MRGRYVVTPDGQHVYVVPAKMLPDQQHKLLDVEREVGPYGDRQLLVLTDGRVAALPMQARHTKMTGEFSAIPSAIAVGAHPTITRDEYDALDEVGQEMYVAGYTTEVTDAALDVSDFRRVELNENITAEAPRNWSPGIQGLIIGPPFDVAFPGWLSGFRARALEIAREYATDTVYDDRGQPKSMTVPIRAYYDPPLTTIVKVMRKQVRQETWQTNQVKVVDINDQIGGTSLIDAERRWAEEEARIRAELAPWTQFRVCSHCNGNGVLPKGAK